MDRGSRGSRVCGRPPPWNLGERRRLAVDPQIYMLKSMKALEAIEALRALASESRLAVFRLLVKRGPKGFTPSDLVERLEVPAPTLSFHLKELARAGLVTSRREGRNLYYGPNVERMNALVGFLTENCCSLADEACDTGCAPLAAPALRKRKRA